VYTKPEDEFFHKHCSWSYTFSTPKVSKLPDCHHCFGCQKLRPLWHTVCCGTRRTAASHSCGRLPRWP